MLFPKTEDFAYLIEKIEKIMKECVVCEMQQLEKLLIGIRDEINVKMRAVETYSNFEIKKLWTIIKFKKLNFINF